MDLTRWTLFWVCCVWFCGIYRTAFADKHAFHDKLMTAGQQLTNNLVRNSRSENEMKTRMNTLWTTTFDKAYTGVPVVVRTQNFTLVLADADIWSLQREQLVRVGTLPTLFPGHSEVHLFKSIEWHGNLFLLLCFKNNQCNLFTSSFSFDISYWQSISDQGRIPIDAEFFVHRNDLFLTVLFQDLNSKTSHTRIYRWHNTYLDQERIPEIMSTAKSVTIFDYKDGVVFILGCMGDDNTKFPSQVWYREPTGEMSKIQYLPTSKPLSITHFVERGENFVLVMEENQDAAIYWWEGREFCPWMSVNGMLKYFAVSVSDKVAHSMFMIFTRGPSLKVCFMTSKKLENILETELLSGDPLKAITILSATMYNDNGKTYMFVLSEIQNQIYMTLFQVHVNLLHTEASDESSSKQYHTNTAQAALDEVFSSIKALEANVLTLETIMPRLLLSNKQANVTGPVFRVSGTVEVQGGEIWNLTNIHVGIAEISQSLSSRSSSLKEEIKSYSSALRHSQVHKSRHLIYAGEVHLRKAKISSILAHTVNNRTFRPEKFLSLTNDQRLSSIKAKTLKVNWLALSHIGNKPVQDLLLENSTIAVPVRVSQLYSKNLQISEDKAINNILARDLTSGTVTVESGDDAFNTVEQVVSEHGSGRGMATTLQLQDHSVIGNLNVDDINNVPFNDLLKSLFRKDIDSVVHGNFHFKKGLWIKNLVPKKMVQPVIPPISEDVQTFPQINQNIEHPSQSPFINPDIKYPPQFKPNVQTRPQFNPYIQYPQQFKPNVQYQQPFIQNVQTRPQLNPYIQYPQQFKPNMQYQPPFNPHVQYIHLLPGGKRTRREAKDIKNPVRIFKTKIKLLGNLKVGRLLFRNSSFITDNQTVPITDLDKVFWTYNSTQVIPRPVHFSQGIVSRHGLQNPIVNGKNLTHYAINSQSFRSLALENIHVVGDILTREETVHPAIQNQSQLGWRFKSFECDVLEVEHLHVEYINEKHMRNILHMDHLLHSDLNIVTGNLSVEGDINAKLINDIDVQEKFDTAVFIDEDFQLSDVFFTNMSARSAKVEYVNNCRADELVDLSHNTSIHIDGNLHVSQLSNVSSVNSKPAKLSLVVNRFKDTTIYGRKSFPSQVSTSHVVVTNINNMSVSYLFGNLFKKSTDQVVTGFYSIRNASIGSLTNVSEVNGISMSKLFYIDQPQVNITNDIHFTSLLIEGNLTASTVLDNCTLLKVGDKVVFDNASVWSSVWIKGDSEWPRSRYGHLQQLFDSAVTTSGDQTITGAVSFSHFFSKTIQVDSLNDKNITFIFEDTLYKNKKNQVISGYKQFIGSFKCDRIKVKGDFKVESLNNINIKDIDTRLIRQTVEDDSLTSPVSGVKTFIKGFTTFRLNCSGGINGILPHDIVVDNYEGLLPPLIVYSLVVMRSIQAKTINNLDIEQFLQECIFSRGPRSQVIDGQFDIRGNAVFQGHVTVPNINNISNNQLIFLRSEKKLPISIKGCKTFSRNIHIERNSEVDILNDKSLIKKYKENVKKYQNSTLNGSLVILSEVDLETVIAKKYFVGNKQLTHLNKTFAP